MFGKQHTGSRCNLLLGMLFLLINFMSVAAPVVKFGDASDTISRHLSSEVPRSGESEEGSHPATASCVGHIQQLSLRRQSVRHVANLYGDSLAKVEKPADYHQHYISSATILPVPGYYRLLFRQNLF